MQGMSSVFLLSLPVLLRGWRKLLMMRLVLVLVSRNSSSLATLSQRQTIRYRAFCRCQEHSTWFSLLKELQRVLECHPSQNQEDSFVTRKCFLSRERNSALKQFSLSPTKRNRSGWSQTGLELFNKSRGVSLERGFFTCAFKKLRGKVELSGGQRKEKIRCSWWLAEESRLH